MDKTMNELQALVDSTVVVEHIRASDSETVKLEGILRAVGMPGIVFEHKGAISIFEWDIVLDVYGFEPKRKVVRRKVRYLIPRRARQHLLDRHGLPWDLVKFVTDEVAFTMHDRISHGNLGHQHREPNDNTPDEEEEAP